MVRDREPGLASEVEQPWKMMELCRIHVAVAELAGSTHSVIVIGYIHLTQKIFVFREYPCSVFVAKCRKLFIVQLV